MIKTMVSGESAPSQLRLYNLGFEDRDGEEILETIVENQFGALKELRLDQNPEFWSE